MNRKTKRHNILTFCTFVAFATVFSSCFGGSGGGSAAPDTNAGSSCSLPTTAGSGIVSGSNVMVVGVGTTSVCSGNVNIPCTSVTVCQVGSVAKCNTISDILVDTGSFGLRIFSQAFTGSLSPPSANLTQVNDASAHAVAECAQFGSAVDWGPVMSADVYLGGEAKVTTSIQVIDHTFGTGSLPAVCSAAETSPSVAGINGILGVGLFPQDCGAGCVGTSGFANLYWGCNGGTCSGTKMPLASQVANPVSLLATDNNGVILDMPAVPSGGSSSAVGSLVLGIDTQANNASAGFTKYPASMSATFSTTFNGHAYASSFIDSGSNGYFFPNSQSLTECSGFYCAGSMSADSATMTGSGGSPSSSVCFTLGDANSLFNSGNPALSDIGADAGFGSTFDWGLPFFYGRKVYVGISGKNSSLGTGPYWAF